MHTGNHGQAQRADHAPRRRDLRRTRRMSLLLLLLVPCACPDSRLERMKSGGRATVAAGEPPVPAVVAAGVAAGMEVPAPGSLVLAHPVPPSSRPVADELAARGSIDPAGLVPPPRPAVAGVVAIPPPEPAPSLVEDIQYLELVVNGARSNFVAPVHVKGGLLAIDAADLRQAGLPLPGAAGSGRVWLDSVPQLSVRLDTAQLMLHLAVPPEWLPMQHVGSRAARAFAPAQASSGALLNYGIHGQHSPQADSLSAWTELRLFGTWGVLSTSLDLPLDLVASQTEQRVAVARGSGYRVDFAVRRVSSARVVLRDLRGEPLPAGTKLRIEGAGDTYVGWEGFAYLEDVSGKETIEAHLPEGGICRASLALDTAGDAVQVRTVICQ